MDAETAWIEDLGEGAATTLKKFSNEIGVPMGRFHPSWPFDENPATFLLNELESFTDLSDDSRIDTPWESLLYRHLQRGCDAAQERGETLFHSHRYR